MLFFLSNHRKKCSSPFVRTSILPAVFFFRTHARVFIRKCDSTRLITMPPHSRSGDGQKEQFSPSVPQPREAAPPPCPVPPRGSIERTAAAALQCTAFARPPLGFQAYPHISTARLPHVILHIQGLAPRSRPSVPPRRVSARAAPAQRRCRRRFQKDMRR